MTVAERLRPRSGRPLDATVDGRIMGATREVVGEVGLARTTWARVSARSGSGYPTMLRRWRSVRELVLDALGDMEREVRIDRAAPATEALTAALADDLATLAMGRDRPFVRTLLFSAADDDEIAAELERALLAPRRARFAALLELGRDRGELGAAADLEAAVRALSAALIGAVVGRRPADRASARRVVEAVLQGAFAPTA